MQYIVIEIQTNADGTVGNLVYSYTDRNEAERQYHLILASAAVSELPAHSAVMLTNDGRCIMSQCYKHAVAVPESEEEAEPDQEPEENV